MGDPPGSVFNFLQKKMIPLLGLANTVDINPRRKSPYALLFFFFKGRQRWRDARKDQRLPTSKSKRTNNVEPLLAFRMLTFHFLSRAKTLEFHRTGSLRLIKNYNSTFKLFDFLKCDQLLSRETINWRRRGEIFRWVFHITPCVDGNQLDRAVDNTRQAKRDPKGLSVASVVFPEPDMILSLFFFLIFCWGAFFFPLHNLY